MANNDSSSSPIPAQSHTTVHYGRGTTGYTVEQCTLADFAERIEAGERFTPAGTDDSGEFLSSSVYVAEYLTPLAHADGYVFHPVLRLASLVYQSPSRTYFIFHTTQPVADWTGWATIAFGISRLVADVGHVDLDTVGAQNDYGKTDLGERLAYTNRNVDDLAAKLQSEFADTMEAIRRRSVEEVRANFASYHKSLAYQDYLQSTQWAEIRNEALNRAGHRCQVCNSPSRLHVHHRTYARRGNENLSDLTVLCAECHETFHKHGKLRGGGI